MSPKLAEAHFEVQYNYSSPPQAVVRRSALDVYASNVERARAAAEAWATQHRVMGFEIIGIVAVGQ